MRLQVLAASHAAAQSLTEKPEQVGDLNTHGIPYIHTQQMLWHMHTQTPNSSHTQALPAKTPLLRDARGRFASRFARAPSTSGVELVKRTESVRSRPRKLTHIHGHTPRRIFAHRWDLRAPV